MAEDNLSAREIVVAFYEAALNEKDVDRAKRYLGDTTSSTTRHVPDGPEGLFRSSGSAATDTLQPQRGEAGHRRGRPGGSARSFVVVPGTPGRRSSTSSGSRMARWSNTGTSSRRSRRSCSRRSTTTGSSRRAGQGG